MNAERRLVSNFAFTSAIICPFSGITVLFTISLTYGGTISFTWGWLIVGFFTLCIGASMAEVVHIHNSLIKLSSTLYAES